MATTASPRKTTTKTAAATAPKKTAAKKTAAKKTTTARQAATARDRVPSLLERDPKVVLGDAGYALAGITADAVEFARHLPERLGAVREEAQKAADQAPERVKTLREAGPDRLRGSLDDLRGRLAKDLEARLSAFGRALDDKASEGRKVAETVRRDDRVKRVLDQTVNTRKQVKAAVTSVRKTADVAVDATRGEGDTA